MCSILGSLMCVHLSWREKWLGFAEHTPPPFLHLPALQRAHGRTQAQHPHGIHAKVSLGSTEQGELGRQGEPHFLSIFPHQVHVFPLSLAYRQITDLWKIWGMGKERKETNLKESLSCLSHLTRRIGSFVGSCLLNVSCKALRECSHFYCPIAFKAAGKNIVDCPQLFVLSLLFSGKNI